MSGHRVPETDPEFKIYITNTTNRLLLPDGIFGTIWQRLGLVAAEKDEWVAFRDNSVALFLLHDSPDTSTPTVTKNKNKLKVDFAKFTEPLLTRIEGSPNIIQADRDVFRIPLPDRTPTSRPQIITEPTIRMKGAGGARIDVEARVTHDATRASMHPDCDVLELKCKVGDPAPASPDTCTIIHLPTKAISFFELPLLDIGKKVYAFARWRNNTDVAKSGPWTDIKSTTIS